MTIALAALLLAAQPAPDRNCTDDRGTDRCAEAQQRRVRDLFGVGTIEAHRDAGDQVRRVFYVDGYGNDVIALSFVRAPGRDPMAFVHFPRREGQPAPELMAAPVPHAVWNEVLQRSAYFERSFVPLPERPGEINICLHSWVYTVEANDPERANLQPASLRRKTEDACANGPAEIFAMDAQRLALGLFPACARLDPDHHRNPASQLGACRLLRGDRLAAAEVLNRADAFRYSRAPEDRHRLAGLFVSGARIEWSGRPHADPAAFWLTRLAEDGRADFYITAVEGLSADRVRLTGALSRYTGGENGVPPTFYEARVEQIWVFGPSQQFQIESARIEPWFVQRPD